MILSGYILENGPSLLDIDLELVLLGSQQVLTWTWGIQGVQITISNYVLLTFYYTYILVYYKYIVTVWKNILDFQNREHSQIFR